MGLPPTAYPHLAPTARPVEHLNRRARAKEPWTTVRIPDQRAAALQALAERTGSNLYAVVNTLIQTCLDEPGLVDELAATGAFPVADKAGRPRKDRSPQIVAQRAAVVAWCNAPHETRGPCPHPELLDEIR